MTERSLTFPRLQRVALADFTLYSLEPSPQITLAEGVTCFVGANGIGKSTLISAINFGLTGRVPDPARSFESVEEYYRHTADFSARFFQGRVSDADIRGASVALDFSIGSEQFSISRMLTEPDGITEFFHSHGSLKDQNTHEDDALSETDRNEAYKAAVLSATGLSTFEQFVFLQLFLFTFDERRHLLFWNERVLEPVLFLAFGVDPDVASKAELWRREDERLDSIARNAQWQATRARRALKDLDQTVGIESDIPEETRAELEALYDSRDAQNSEIQTRIDELDDIRLRVNSLSSEDLAVQSAFDDLFSHRATGQIDPSVSRIVRSLIDDAVCPACNAEGAALQRRTESRLSEETCPVCGEAVQVDTDDPILPELAALEDRRRSIQNNLRAALDASRSAEDALDEARGMLDHIVERIANIEGEYDSIAIDRGSDRVDQLRASYQREITEQQARRDDNRQRRDEVRQELGKLRRGLHERYIAVEEEFLPLFEELAQQFLGEELTVSMEERTDAARIQLLVSLKSAPRRYTYSMSESQRYFIDIALRMALARYLAPQEARTTMLVDTPEGSLDLAYEAKAGEMFGTFVRDGHLLLMTANINTSQLLQQLAYVCGSDLMSVVRMTQWAELSSVQIESEDRFDSAYARFEQILSGEDSP